MIARLFRNKRVNTVPSNSANGKNDSDVYQDVVDSIVNISNFSMAMLAIVQQVGDEEHLVVRAFAAKSGLFAQMVLEYGQRITNKNLIGNYVVMDKETEKINKAVAAIRNSLSYEIVDHLYDLFAPRVNHHTADLIQKFARVNKMITIPFRNREGKLVGNMYAGTEAKQITQTQIQQLIGLSHMATIAVENTLLQYQTQRTSGREDVLKEIMLQMMSASLSEQRLTQTIVDSVVERLGFRASMLSLVRQHGDIRILPVVSYQFDGALGRMIERAEQLAGIQLKGAWVEVNAEVAKTNIGVRAILEELPAQRTPNLSDLFSPVINPAMSNTLQRMFGIKALVTVPLRTKEGKLRGNLYAGTERSEISDVEIEELQTFALAASTAIENMQHVRETRRMGLLASNPGNVMHKLNGILSSTQYDLNTLQVEFEQSGQKAVADQLETTREEIIRAIVMIQGLHRRMVQMEDESQIVDVHEAIDRALETLSDFNYVIPDEIKVKKQYTSQATFILAEREQLSEVFRVLIKNACEAMGTSGLLTLKTEKPKVGTSDQSMIQVTVLDTGHGIPATIRSSIFDAKTSTKTNGLGYGLWSARLTIEWFEGKIVCESLTQAEIDAQPTLRGSTPFTKFIVTLPTIDISKRQRMQQSDPARMRGVSHDL